MRLAARPWGAQSRRLTPLAARIRRMELTMVVWPTPGPPVMTRTFAIRARRMAATWLSASWRRSSARSRAALDGIDKGPGQLAGCQLSQALRNHLLGAIETGQKMQGVSPPCPRSRCLLQVRAQGRSGSGPWGLRASLLPMAPVPRPAVRSALVHGLGQGIGDPGPDPHHGRLLDAELMAMASAVLKPIPRISRPSDRDSRS